MFGDVLRELVEQRFGPRHARDVADRIGVDASLVRRWLRNERVPALDSSYVDWITVALVLSPEERARLRQAQIESLSMPQKTLKHARSDFSAIRDFLSAGMPERAAPQRAVVSAEALSATYEGPAAFLRAFAAVVDALPINADGSRLETFIVVSTRPTVTSVGEELEQLWTSSILTLMQKGWDYYFIAPRSKSLDVRQLIQRLMQLAEYGPGRFTNYLVNPAEWPVGPNHLVVFPKIAVLGLPGSGAVPSSSALVLTDPGHVELLRRQAEHLRQIAQPAMSLYGPKDVDLIDRIAEVEHGPGEHLLVKDGLSVLTYPRDWLQVERLWSSQVPVTRTEFARLLEVNRGRVEHFYVAVSHDPWLDVSSQRTLRQLAETGHFRNPDIVQARPLSLAERKAFLLHLVDLLDRFPSYQLALAADEEIDLLEPAMWMVHGQQGVVLRRPARGGRYSTFVSHDERLTRSLYQYFHAEIWQGIHPAHRDRHWVRDFITTTIARLDAAS